MDIEFIQEEHRDNIFKVMELCGCEMNEAYELYNNNGCNVENAVQAKFNAFNGPQPVISHPSHQTYSKHSSSGNNNNFGIQNFQRQVGEEDEYENFKIFKESGMNFGRRYEVRKENSGIASSVFSFFKSAQNTFKKHLQTYIGRKTNLSLQNGSLSEALQSVSKQKFPLIVHTLDFNPKQQALLNNIKKIYSDQYLVQMMSEQFKNFGLDTRVYQLEPFLRPFIDLKTDSNSLIIFRINIIEEIVLISKISLNSTTIEEIKKKMKQVKSNCINSEMEEMHYEKRYQEEMKGNLDYKKPMTLAEKRKLHEDREIRRKQEEEFYAAMQPAKQSQKSSNTHGQSFTSKPQISPIKKDMKAQARQQRKKIRDSLKIYDTDGEGMLAIKLRLPSSELIKLYVHSKEPAQYLYDYVLSREEDLGFEEDESKRVFDIIEPYEKINLSEQKQEKLGKIFEGQSMLTLVVNEKSE